MGITRTVASKAKNKAKDKIATRSSRWVCANPECGRTCGKRANACSTKCSKIIARRLLSTAEYRPTRQRREGW